MDSVSSLSASSPKPRRGWNGLGSMSSTETDSRPDVVVSTSLRSELSPRPNAFLCMANNLFSELPVAFRSARPRVVSKDWLAVARRLGQSHVARDDCRKDLASEKILQVVADLARQVGPIIVHSEQDALDSQR